MYTTWEREREREREREIERERDATDQWSDANSSNVFNTFFGSH